MPVVRSLTLVLAFTLELAMIAALVLWGWTEPTSVLVKVLAGLGLPAVVVAVWARFLAPRAGRRLPWPWLPAMTLLLFWLGALALHGAGHSTAALVMAVASAVDVGLVVLLERR